ncbi:Leucine-rich repeat and calponin-likey domain-containing protein 3 [Papilio xuthus]|uniref:Leucine-rich repeat and calponin-likey domain-containing protein 3 n=1 Tax=Papilio xuthus TaxID=66420 RepID=A0A194Q5A5_PAPXU|nr:Leucine-rich repeat and calponin-likey domain-containing protein 3 [Papilio xuthus]
MNGHNNIHSQLTKSLERILEDAYLSGELKLSGRKLREFPKPVKFDLSDTVVADLSKNRFSDVPDEVTTYVYLEKLLLSQNIIRSVPETVGGLQSLTYLDLRLVLKFAFLNTFIMSILTFNLNSSGIDLR